MLEVAAVGGLLAVVGSWVGNAVGGGVAGNIAYDGLKGLKTAIAQRTRGLQGELPSNHDVAKALRSAQLDGIEYVLSRHQRREGATALPISRARLKAKLSAARNEVEQLAWGEGAERALFASFERALATTTPGQSGVDPTVERAVAESWREVEAWLEPAGAPEDLRERFFGETGATSWWAAFGASLTERLKTQPRFRDALFAGQLVKLGDRQVSGPEVWADMVEATAALAADMKEVLGHLEALREDTMVIRDDTAEIKTLIRRLQLGRSGKVDDESLNAVSDYAAGRITFHEAIRRAPAIAPLLADLGERLDARSEQGRTDDLLALRAEIAKLRLEETERGNDRITASWVSTRIKRVALAIFVVISSIFIIGTLQIWRMQEGQKLDRLAETVVRRRDVNADGGTLPWIEACVSDSPLGTGPLGRKPNGPFSCERFSDQDIAKIKRVRLGCVIAQCSYGPDILDELKTNLTTAVSHPVLANKAAYVNYCMMGGEWSSILERRDRFHGAIRVVIADQRENWDHHGDKIEYSNQNSTRRGPPGNPGLACSGSPANYLADGALEPDRSSWQVGVGWCRPIRNAVRRPLCEQSWPVVLSDVASAKKVIGAL